MYTRPQTNSVSTGRRNLVKGSSPSPLLNALRIPQLGILMLVILALSISSEAGSVMAWVLVGAWALRGPAQAVEALLLSLLLNYLNLGIFHVVDQGALLRWVVLLLAAGRVAIVVFNGKLQLPRWMKYIVLFVAVALLTSLFRSPLIAVSIFKLFAFIVGAFTIYLGVALGNREWVSSLITYGTIIALASLPLLRSPLGYLRNGLDFQGILSHPQSYGVFIALPFTVALVKWLFEQPRQVNIWKIVILVVMGATLYLSVTRSAYFAVILAIPLALLVHRHAASYLNSLLFHPLTYFLMAAAILALYLVNPIDELKRFAFERDYEQASLTAGEAITITFASREKLIERSWQNFLDSPITGIGFGISSLPDQRLTAQTIGGIPIVFPVEKGFILTALLEEIGVLGFMTFLLLVLAQVRSLQRNRTSFALIALFFTALFVNLGEMVYFSIGGIGVLIHTSIAAALFANMQSTITDTR